MRHQLAAAFSAEPRAAAYVRCLQGIATSDRGAWVEPRRAADAARQCGGLQAGVVQLEEQMLYAGRLQQLMCSHVCWPFGLLRNAVHCQTSRAHVIARVWSHSSSQQLKQLIPLGISYAASHQCTLLHSQTRTCLAPAQHQRLPLKTSHPLPSSAAPPAVMWPPAALQQLVSARTPSRLM